MKRFIGVLGLLLAISARTSAGVVVNEALVNEPGSAVTLEWVELYNDSSGAVDLSYYLLASGSSSVNLSGFINPNSYLVVCRNLFSSGSTPGFEGIWGNNSGVWGDAPQENYRVVQGRISLVNAAGSARLYHLSTVVSQLNWPSAGSDGISWERVSVQSDDAAPSQDPAGATPGRVNSVSPLPNDLSVDTIAVQPDSGRAQITVRIINVGLDTSLATSLLIHTYNPADSSGIGDTLQLLALAPVAPGDSVS